MFIFLTNLDVISPCIKLLLSYGVGITENDNNLLRSQVRIDKSQ